MLAVIGWVALGFILALLSKVLLRYKDPDGTLLLVLIGIAGALFGGLLTVALADRSVDEPAVFFAALLGSLGTIALKTWVSKSEERNRVHQR